MNGSSRKGVKTTKSAAEKTGVKTSSGTVAQTPDFGSELQERKFWERTDSALRVDWSTEERVRLASLKPASEAILLDW